MERPPEQGSSKENNTYLFKTDSSVAVFKTFMYVHLLTIFVASCINLQIKEQISNFCSAPCQAYFTFLSVSSGLSTLDTEKRFDN